MLMPLCMTSDSVGSFIAGGSPLSRCATAPRARFGNALRDAQEKQFTSPEHEKGSVGRDSPGELDVLCIMRWRLPAFTCSTTLMGHWHTASSARPMCDKDGVCHAWYSTCRLCQH